MGTERTFPSVAIKLLGRPTQGLESLVKVLMGHGCPRRLSWAVAQNLQISGVRNTRVKPHVDLVKLAVDLLPHGIVLSKSEL